MLVINTLFMGMSFSTYTGTCSFICDVLIISTFHWTCSPVELQRQR